MVSLKLAPYVSVPIESHRKVTFMLRNLCAQDYKKLQ